MKELGYRVDFTKSSVIKKLYLELTDRCNLNCKICYRRNWESKPIDMSKENFHKLLNDIEEIEGLKDIVIGGIGEPTLYPEVGTVLEALKSYKLHVTTNGTQIKGSLVQQLVNTTRSITISVDGVGENFYEIRGTELNELIEGIKSIQAEKQRLKSVYPHIQLQFVASTFNIDQVYHVIDLAKELNCQKVIVSNYIPQQETDRSAILYTVGTNDEGKKRWHQIRNYALRKGIPIHLPHIELKTERGCAFIEDMATYITAQGDVVPCYRLSHNSKEYVFQREKQVSKYSFGNIQEQSLLDIWNDDSYKRFRYQLHHQLYPSCMDCDLVEGCELPKTSQEDCYGQSPSCGDCLWGRKFVVCP